MNPSNSTRQGTEPAADPTAAAAVTPVDGKTTIDDKMRFGPLLLSYRSACDITRSIAAAVAERVDGRTVVIADTSVLAEFANLQAALLTLEGLQRDYESIARFAASIAPRVAAVPLRPKSAAGEENFSVAAVAAIAGAATVVAPVASLVTAALGVVSLFREDVEYRGSDTTIDRFAFNLQVAAHVRAVGAARVFVPATMIVPLAEASPGSLRHRLAAIERAKAEAWVAAAPLVAQLAVAEAQLDVATRNKDKEAIDRWNTKVSDLRRELEPLVGPLTRADQTFADLQTQWARIEQNQELSLLARMLRAEAIHALSPVYLHCDVVASGGHHRITRSLWRSMFSGDGISFTGGAVARWAILGEDGSVDQGGILPAHHTIGPQ